MANWDWNGGNGGHYQSRRDYSGGHSSQNYFGTHFYDPQHQRSDYFSYSPNLRNPQNSQNGFYDMFAMNYQGYQPQNYIPTMVYSNNTQNRSDYQNYNQNYNPNPSENATREAKNERKVFKKAKSFPKKSWQQQERAQQQERPPQAKKKAQNWEAKPSYIKKNIDVKRNWKEKRDSICQRERLIDQLHRGTLECLVCCERIRQHNAVWSCSNCYHILHLNCTVKWASSSKDENGWRCPACQNTTKIVPTEYFCMCGKVRKPEFVRGETPHCCGQICGKKNNCPHLCTILCHPGPCPNCCANVKRFCGCGRTETTVMCSSTVKIECENVCGKSLNCGVHLCEDKCHQGECKACTKKIDQRCFCGGSERSLVCDGSVIPEEMGGSSKYECGSQCPHMLSCSAHKCPLKCHRGECPLCRFDPIVMKNCPCGKQEIPETRTKCTDDIPLCGNVCGKELPCGDGERHKCQSKCHLGDCPPCEQVSKVKCRCGLIEKQVPCKESGDILCQKRCSKKRTCGKHKCNQLCCIDEEHICPFPCNKSLNCGRHKCERLCHRGHCSPCLAASFEELHCECGKSVILPPVACGTRPPECNEPCSREHPCGHPPLHNCHSYPECPPCSVLTTKYCYGAHEMRKTIPCHQGEYSCGIPCGRALECGHKCIRKCHDGSCLENVCSQPCPKPRGCDHPCSAPCHPNKPCPTTACTAKLKITCECGRRSVARTCSENSSEYQRIETSLLAAKIADVRLGKTVDTSDVSVIARKMSLKTLECNDDCRKQERNLRLAISLQIANPDLSAKFAPKYSETMKSWVKKDARFCEMVHEKLTQLVQLSKQSKQKSRSYSFPSMNAPKRQFIHEYCEHFGVESVAYDPEPNRNIVATAYKEKVWMPSYSLLEVVQRESGHRKVPSLLPSLKKDTSIKEPTKLVPVQKKIPVQPSVAKHEPECESP